MKRTLTLSLLLLSFLFGLNTTQAQVDIGTGTTTNFTSGAAPINIWYRSMHYQVVYTAAELTASGALPGDAISELGWYVTGVPVNDLPNYTIKMKHTTALDASVYDNVGLTTTVVVPLHAPTAGTYDMTPFTSNFVWNGVSNLLVDVCFDQVNPTYNMSGQVRTFSGSSRYVRSDGSSQCGVATTTNLTYRPQVRLTMSGGTIPSCPMPTGLNVTNLLATTADLNWSAGSSLLWLVEYGPTGFTPGTGTLVTSSTYTATMLTANTTYDWYVAAFCAVGDTSFLAGPNTFTTPCATETASWTYDVESALATTNGTIEDCWTSNPAGPTSTYRWNITGTGTTPSSNTGALSAYSGNQYFYTEASSGSTGSVAELITPNVDVSALTTTALMFRYHFYGATIDKMYIDVFDGSSWITNVDSIVGQHQTHGDSAWLFHTTDLTVYTGVIQVKFRGIKGTSFTGDMCLDNIRIDDTPTCNQPTNLVDSIIDPYSAYLSWTSGGASNWIVEYGPTGFTPGSGTIISASSNSLTISGLSPDTDYDWFVSDSCSATDISWASLIETFRTPAVIFCDSTNNFTYCYQANELSSYTYQSENNTSLLHIYFNAGMIQGWGNTFIIYDGPDDTYPILYSATATTDVTGVDLTSSSSIVTFSYDASWSSCSTPLDFDINCCEHTTFTQNINICTGSTYTLPDGVIITDNGAYYSTLVNALGCDSIITTILNVLEDTTNISEVICSGSNYTLPNGTVVTSPGFYVNNLFNQLSCDSIVNVTLSLAMPTAFSTSASVCDGDSYEMPDGSFVSTSGSHFITFTNAAGCDSTYNVNLSLLPLTAETVNESICEGDNYTLPDGVVVNTAGSYTSLTVNMNNCQHTITTNLSINATQFYADSIEICNDDVYTLVNGDVVDLAGEYNVNVSSSTGCDSIITIYVSKCISTGVNGIDGNAILNIYPNPTNDILNIVLNDENITGTILLKVLNALGQDIYTLDKVKNNLVLDVSTYAEGIYYIVLNDETNTTLRKFIVSK